MPDAGPPPTTRGPSPFLEEVRARKEREVAAREAAVSTEALRDRVEPTPRSLAGALRRPGCRAILEVKRRSPSLGALRPDEPVGAAVADYRGAADAISVLVDSAFDGQLDDLSEARRRTDAPLLAKDFVLGPRQVLEARAAGADAVLLILSLIDDDTARTCLAEAEALGMDALVETHDRAEIERAIALGAAVIGVNNRDLKSLHVDLARTEALAGLVPEDRVLITESGVRTRADIDRLAPLVDGFLIGSALMQAEAGPDPGAPPTSTARPPLAAGRGRFDAARALTFGRLKVCGLTRPEDAALVDALGARFGGVVLAASPRRASVEQAAAIAQAAPDLPLVAVFRDQSAGEILSVVEELTGRGLALAAAQVHGALPDRPGLLAEVRARLNACGLDGLELWAARGVEVSTAGDAERPDEGRKTAKPQEEDLGAVAGLAREPGPAAGVDRLVLDAARQGRSGGTGQAFAWDTIDDQTLREALLAGGINPQNVRAARATGAWGVDASSGLESSPGAKDPEKLRAFFDAARPGSRRDRAEPAREEDRAHAG